ncbi:MAG TPA: hypothetical protein DIW47_14175 [Bacteroidetes bacterium]|nr:hypothetical protein [Bacteroidota bacterium]
MKKINQLAWIALAGLSFVVGTWVLIAEGPLRSKFYVFYLFTMLLGILIFLKRKFPIKNAKPKKRR